MYLNHLKLTNFKNLSSVDIELTAHINCLLGENGSGKTNFLDAIHYLSLTKSAFNTSDSATIQIQTDFFRIDGFVSVEEEQKRLEITFSNATKKTLKIDGEVCEKMSTHIGRFPVVLIAPDDTDLIRESGELRRKFFDGIICQLDSAYLDLLMKYNHLLKQRNALLKKIFENQISDKTLLEVYDENLIPLAKEIAQHRNQFIEKFIDIFKSEYHFLTNDKENCTLTYDSEALNPEFENIFKRALEKDILLGRTTKGIHTDDYEFKIDGLNVKKMASQGQKKSFVIALKLAQFEMIWQKAQTKPFLLLDDIFDKLDDFRIMKLIELIASQRFGQVFITDARPERSQQLLANVAKVVNFYSVKAGEIQLTI